MNAQKLKTRWMNVWKVTDGKTVAFVSQSKMRAADGEPSFAAGKAGKCSFTPTSKWTETFADAAEMAIERKRVFMAQKVEILA